jgi:hypothetical protein
LSEVSAGVASTSRSSSPFVDGRSVGIGSLPHRDADAAAAFALAELDVPTVPTLPKRSPAESRVAQAIVGLPGVSLGQYGSVLVDPAHLTDDRPVVTDLDHDAFGGLRAFLARAAAVGHDGQPVKWQFVGPVTLGVALQRAGLPATVAFPLAGRAVRAHLASLAAAVTAALPSSPQMAILDEPSFAELMRTDFPIPPDEAVDLMSTAMAALPAGVVAGVHCSGPCDVATMLAAGPRVISVPVAGELVEWAGYLTRFVEEGGVVVWGAVTTDGPVASSPERPWRTLSDLWCALVRRGCDPVTLRRQSLVSTTGGLVGHSVSMARRLARLTAAVAARVKDQATAARFSLGA